MLKNLAAISIYLLNAYEDYFPVNNGILKRYDLIASIHKYEIVDCYFSSIYMNDNGVVLYMSSAPFNIYIESTVFSNISSPNNDGTLYISSCSCVIKNVCAYSCSLRQGHLIYGINLNGKICLLSYVSMGGFFGTSTQSPIYLKGGQSKLDYTNSSRHYIGSNSAFYIESPSIFSVEYINIIQNYASSYNCLNFVSPPQNTTLKLSNIINNTHSNSGYSYGVILTNSLVEITYSYFSGNLYYLFVGTMYVMACFIKHPSYLANGAMMISANGVNDGTYPFNCINNVACMISTYSIRHFASAFCETPIHPITPTSSIDQPCLPCPTEWPVPTPAQTMPS